MFAATYQKIQSPTALNVSERDRETVLWTVFVFSRLYCFRDRERCFSGKLHSVDEASRHFVDFDQKAKAPGATDARHLCGCTAARSEGKQAPILARSPQPPPQKTEKKKKKIQKRKPKIQAKRRTKKKTLPLIC